VNGIYITSVAKSLIVLCAKIIKIGGRVTKLQPVKTALFYETRQNATNIRFQFIIVVRQHILSVVETVLCRLVGNVTCFPPVKAF